MLLGWLIAVAVGVQVLRRRISLLLVLAGALAWPAYTTAASARRSTVQPSVPSSSQRPISATARTGSSATCEGHTRTCQPAIRATARGPTRATFLSKTTACSAPATWCSSRAAGMTSRSQTSGSVRRPCQLGSPKTLPARTPAQRPRGPYRARQQSNATPPASQKKTTHAVLGEVTSCLVSFSVVRCAGRIGAKAAPVGSAPAP